MKKKFFYFSLLIFFLVGSLFYFFADFEKSSSENSENDINVLTVYEYNDKEKDGILSEINQIYPNANVNFDAVVNKNDNVSSQVDLTNRIEKKTVNGNYHVILGLKEDLAYDLSKRNLLSNIHSYFKPLEQRYNILQDYSESVPGNGVDETYMIPVDFRGYSLIYNKTLITKLEVKEPSNAESWETIYDLSEKINERSNNAIAPFTYGGNFPPLSFKEFEDYIAPLNTQKNELNKDFKEVWTSFVNAYGDYSMNVYDGGEFVRGNIAMQWVDTTMLFDLLDQMEKGNLLGSESFDYNVVSSPSFTSGTSIYGKVNNVVAVPENQKDLNVSGKLINIFFKDQFVNAAFSEESTLLPIHTTPKLKKAYKNEHYDLNTFYPDKLKFSKLYEQNIKFRGADIMYDSIRGKKTPEESFGDFKAVLENKFKLED